MFKTLKKESDTILMNSLRMCLTMPVGQNKAPIKPGWRKFPKVIGAKNIMTGNRGCFTGEINDITVIDLDLYKQTNINLFVKTFGENYVKTFDTLTQSTANGGVHLVFKYDKEIRQTANHQHSIDIRNDGGYVVCSGSSCKKKDGTLGKYKIINDTTIKQISPELKNWLITHIISKSTEVKKIAEKENKIAMTTSTIGYYDYNWNNEQTEELFNKLPKHYWITLESWIKLGTAMKMMNKGEYFLKRSIYFGKKYGRTDYNKQANLKLYNQLRSDLPAVVYNIMKAGNCGIILDYIKCKAIHSINLPVANRIGNWDKLSNHITLPSNNIIIKSDTGTGKTTIVKKYLLDNPDTKFISIVSRISLAEEQYQLFREEELDCTYYGDINEFDPFKNGDSCVICADSLMKISRQLDATNYIIFLDEFNSLLEHIVSSTTLSKYRVLIYTNFIKILQNAKQIIATDADIQGHTLKWLDMINVKYTLYENTFQHNKNVVAKEWNNSNDMLTNMMSKDKWILCCDSKRASQAILAHYTKFIELTNDEKERFRGIEVLKDELGYIACITSDTKTTFRLDDFDRIIISPKVIYGLDSSILRYVYCYYEEQTINARAMVQQISRTRNIIELNFYFDQKHFTIEKYNDLIDAVDYQKKLTEYGAFETLCTEDILTTWSYLESIIQYNNDCYKTNQFAHFVKTLQDRGVELKLNWSINETKNMKELKQIKLEDDYETFNYDSFSPNHDKVKSRNEWLKLTNDTIKKNRGLFICDDLANQHKNLTSWITMSEEILTEKVHNINDFVQKKVKTNYYKMAFLIRFLKKCGITNKYDIIPKNTKLIDLKIQNEFYSLFPTRIQNKPDLTNNKNAGDAILIMIKQLFGSSMPENYEEIKTTKNSIKILKIERKRINGKQTPIKTGWNMDIINNTINIAKHRFQKNGETTLISFNELHTEIDDEDQNIIQDDILNNGICLIEC